MKLKPNQKCWMVDNNSPLRLTLNKSELPKINRILISFLSEEQNFCGFYHTLNSQLNPLLPFVKQKRFTEKTLPHDSCL